ncbi:MAG: glycosyltransferase family 9 protein [Nitrospirae bacterium]|nr:glycosyltransferase family 9 protein [Nitrospirota bacterium]
MAPKFLVVQLTRLGDLLQTTPLISGLRERHPEAFIAALVNKRFEKALAGHPDLDEIFLLDADFLASWHAGNREDFLSGHHRISDLARTLRALKFDCVFNASFNDIGGTMARLAGSREVRGYVARLDGSLDAPDFIGRYFHAEIQGSHFPQPHVADVLQCLGGFAPRGKPYTSPPGDGGDWGHHFLNEHSADPGEVLIGVQPGSNSERKGLPAEAVASLAVSAAAKPGRRIVILGSIQERECFERIRALTSAPLVDATGIGWRELSSLIPRLAVLVSGDTAPAHLATALGTRVIAIFRGESHYSITGPYGNGHWSFDPPGPEASLPPVECIIQVVEAAIAGGEPALLPAALRGWKLYRSEFGPDGWLRTLPHRATALSEADRVRLLMLGWWKRLLRADTDKSRPEPAGMPHPAGEASDLPEASAELIRSNLLQAEVLLQETVMALSTANGQGIRIMEQNDRLLERLDDQTPGKVVSPLLRLLSTEKSLVFSKDPSVAREETIQAYRRLQDRLANLRRFLAP